MPIYEYELKKGDCQICSGRFEALQGIEEGALTHCPTCGLEVIRVVSRATFKTREAFSAGKAGEKGLTTYRRAGKGQWEKVAGPGVDAIVGTPEDTAAIESDTTPKLDLDKG
jgi:putative FmdB family regulatory protein